MATIQPNEATKHAKSGGRELTNAPPDTHSAGSVGAVNSYVRLSLKMFEAYPLRPTDNQVTESIRRAFL